MPVLMPKVIELHLDTLPLTRSERDHIHAAGGRYSACRGYKDVRFVHLPVEAEALVNRLLRAHPRYESATARSPRRGAVVFRDFGNGYDPRPAWVHVHRYGPSTTLEDLLLQYRMAAERYATTYAKEA